MYVCKNTSVDCEMKYDIECEELRSNAEITGTKSDKSSIKI